MRFTFLKTRKPQYSKQHLNASLQNFPFFPIVATTQKKSIYIKAGIKFYQTKTDGK